MSTLCQMDLRWMPPYICDDVLSLIQVMVSVSQQAIVWTINDPYLCRHKASLCHNELRMENACSNQKESTCYILRDQHILTHWCRVTHICISKIITVGSDNGLSPGRCQAIIWTNAGILSIGPLGTNFGEIVIDVQSFSSKKMHLIMSSAKWRQFCPGLNVLNHISVYILRTSLLLSQLYTCYFGEISVCLSATAFPDKRYGRVISKRI